MYFMISKEANDLLLHGLEYIALFTMFMILLPLTEAVLWVALPFRDILPEPKRFCQKYYGGLMKIFIRR